MCGRGWPSSVASPCPHVHPRRSTLPGGWRALPLVLKCRSSPNGTPPQMALFLKWRSSSNAAPPKLPLLLAPQPASRRPSGRLSPSLCMTHARRHGHLLRTMMVVVDGIGDETGNGQSMRPELSLVDAEMQGRVRFQGGPFRDAGAASMGGRRGGWRGGVWGGKSAFWGRLSWCGLRGDARRAWRTSGWRRSRTRQRAPYPRFNTRARGCCCGLAAAA
jgi:hypothetical protein